jgi:hypothetical protein
MVDRYLTAQQVTDRLAIRELIDKYAYFADRRDDGQKAAGSLASVSWWWIG